MPADFLSRNIASISSVLDNDLHLLQSQDKFISDLIKLVKFNSLPADGRRAHYLKTIVLLVFLRMIYYGAEFPATICPIAMFFCYL